MNPDEAGVADELLRRAQAGESAAFAAIVRRYQRTVHCLASRMLADRHKAEDLAQDVFLQLHRKLGTIESDAHLAQWLRKIATHRAIDRLRQEPAALITPLDDDIDAVSDAVDADPLLQRRLSEIVSTLPPIPRAVILLRYQEDLEPLEIARTLDMSINTVKSHLKRSLATLRRLAVTLVDPETGSSDAHIYAPSRPHESCS